MPPPDAPLKNIGEKCMKKNVKSLILSLLAMLTVSSLVACDVFAGDSTGGGSTSDVTSESVDVGDSSIGDAYEDVTISLSEAEGVMRFATKQLTATVKGTQETVAWASSNPAVATVDENGLVSALTLGETVITATIGTVSASCTVTVFETDIPHEVEVSLDEVSVFEGKTSEEVTVSVSYDGETVEGEFQYSWSLVEGDEDVVSVTPSADGSSATFQGLKVGTVTYEIYTEARGYVILIKLNMLERGAVFAYKLGNKIFVKALDKFISNGVAHYLIVQKVNVHTKILQNISIQIIFYHIKIKKSIF